MDPLAEIRSRSGVDKRDDETLREYVERAGRENGVDPDVLGDAIDFLTRWQYARTPPERDQDFRMFLFQLGDESELPPAEAAENGAATPAAGRPAFEPVPELRPLRDERRKTRSAFKGGLRGREPRLLLLRFAVMLVTAPVLGWMMSRTWVPGNLVYDRGEQLLGTALGLSGVAALELVGSFGIGVYAALLVLFVVDVKKRIQGMLLAMGSVLVLAVLTASGVFLPNVEYAAPLNGLGLILGFASGLLVEADQLRALDPSASTFRRPTLDTGDVPEFRHAVAVLFWLVAVVVVGSLANAVVTGVVRAYDVAAAGAFLAMSYRFVRYESETRYVTLGPARAGKSMLTLGLCLELLDSDGPHPDPNDYLQSGLERVSNLQPGDERWPVPSTPPDDLQVSSFEVIAGYYFPRRLELTALDYAGQHLRRVAELLERGDERTDGVPAEVAGWIRRSDTLVVLLDVERLVYPEKFQETGVTDGENVSWGLDQYATILGNTDPDEVVVVATKCDILVDRKLVDPPSVHGSYDEFREAVTERLASRPDVRELLELTGCSRINPVYYVTRRRGSEYVPQLDENGNPMPVGFSHLLAAFRRRQ